MTRYCAHDPLDTPYHDQFSDFSSWLELWESEFHGPTMITEWCVANPHIFIGGMVE